jgi:hypothetical protein
MFSWKFNFYFLDQNCNIFIPKPQIANSKIFRQMTQKMKLLFSPPFIAKLFKKDADFFVRIFFSS